MKEWRSLACQLISSRLSSTEGSLTGVVVMPKLRDFEGRWVGDEG
jgi:hypothetical protein